MILYSIIPGEIVFRNNEAQDSGNIEMEYMGEKVIVSKLEDNKYVICRLISTSPKAYLNPKLQPGTIIDRSLRHD